MYICNNCGCGFTAKKQNKTHIPQFCSRKCFAHRKVSEETKSKQSLARKGKTPWNKGTKMWENREHPKGTIGKSFSRPPISEETRKKLSNSHTGIKYPNHSGSKHHNWQGGITNKNEVIRKSSEYKQWRVKVFKRDDYTCLRCRKKGGYLHAHHIQSFAEFPNLRFEVSNGETVCRECHGLEHGLVYGEIALNKCPDCGKKIKVGANTCLPCRKLRTARKKVENLKCLDCGKIRKSREAERCMSCSAKLRGKIIGNFGKPPDRQNEP